MFMENIRAKMNIFHDNFAVVMKNVYRCSCVCTAMISIFCLSKVDLLNPPPKLFTVFLNEVLPQHEHQRCSLCFRILVSILWINTSIMPHILVRDQEEVEVLKISKIATMDILYGFESPVWT